MLNHEKNQNAVRPMRNTIIGVKRKRSQGMPEKDPEGFAAYYRDVLKKVAEHKVKAREYEDKIYAAARPVPRRYEFIRIGD